jgi:hypothetical protein
MTRQSWAAPYRAVLAATFAAFAAAGCAALPQPAGPDPLQVSAAIGAAAEQVKRCYRAPRVASAGKQIATRLRVRFAPDGSLAGLPSVVGQTGVTAVNRAYASRMAEAASLAVIRCAPLHLPPELYESGWDELDLTFSPRRLA